MKDFAIKNYVKIPAWLCAIIIVSLNVKLVYETIKTWIVNAADPTVLYFTVVPIAVAAGLLLLYIVFKPVLEKSLQSKAKLPHAMSPDLQAITPYAHKRIAICVDFSDMDRKSISHALAQGGADAQYLLIHVVESAGAIMMESDIDDYETVSDDAGLNSYAIELREKGYNSIIKLGYGNPKKLSRRSLRNSVQTCSCSEHTDIAGSRT